jgi:hypothetical protein
VLRLKNGTHKRIASENSITSFMAKEPSFTPRPEHACLCGRSKLLRDCCLLQDGTYRTKAPSLDPPPPQTHYANPNCYLSYTRDCSKDISAEHYVSKSVLEAFGKNIVIEGTPWLSVGEKREVGINSLTAKILCKRHNSALAPLDHEAGKFYGRIQANYTDLQRKSLSRKRSFLFVSGEAIEHA